MVDFLDQGAMRVSVVKVLTENEKKIIDELQNSCSVASSIRRSRWQRLRTTTEGSMPPRLQLVPPIGDLRRSGRQHRDDPGHRSDRAREMYNSLGVPMPGMVEAMKAMKTAALALLSDQQVKVASPYFDFLIQGMQTPT